MAEYVNGRRLHMGYSFELLTEDFSSAHIRGTVERLESVMTGGWPCWAISNHDVQRAVRLAAARAAAGTDAGGAGVPCAARSASTGARLDCRRRTSRSSCAIMRHRLHSRTSGRDGCRTPTMDRRRARRFHHRHAMAAVPAGHRTLSRRRSGATGHVNAVRAFSPGASGSRPCRRARSVSRHARACARLRPRARGATTAGGIQPFRIVHGRPRHDGDARRIAGSTMDPWKTDACATWLRRALRPDPTPGRHRAASGRGCLRPALPHAAPLAFAPRAHLSEPLIFQRRTHEYVWEGAARVAALPLPQARRMPSVVTRIEWRAGPDESTTTLPFGRKMLHQDAPAELRAHPQSAVVATRIRAAPAPRTPTARPSNSAGSCLRHPILDRTLDRHQADLDPIVEAISAEDIGKLPDASIAESIARLPA